MVRRVEELLAWQLCMELDEHVGVLTKDARVARDFDFCRQLRRAAGAAAPLIAEGFGRFGTREFVRYLRMAIGSLTEAATHLHRGRHLDLYADDAHGRAVTLCNRARRMTVRLLQAELAKLPPARPPAASKPPTRRKP